MYMCSPILAHAIYFMWSLDERMYTAKTNFKAKENGLVMNDFVKRYSKHKSHVFHEHK
jgi:hypothetical protein